ncbi:MAG: sensor diguanylate cyclase [Devosia sp.]|nr:sensor diguanylate cyclase [Devosia sp.]
MTDSRLTDEDGRLAALQRYEILDTAEDEAFNRITALAQLIVDVPIAALSLIDRDRQHFKSILGLARHDLPRSVAFCAYTIRQSEPLMVADAAADERFRDNPLVTGVPYVRAYLGVPMTTPDGYNIGSLCAVDTMPRSFDSRQAAMLEHLAGLAVELMELRQTAKTDVLTGALTRRGFLTGVEREFARARRYGRPAVLIIFDIDRFKAINDSFGHPAGDAALTAIGQCVSETMRKSDLFGRLGGEEFGLLLAETELEDGLLVAERLRQLIADLVVRTGRGSLTLTASFGLAPLGRDIAAVDQWLVEADVALYEAKRDGRNRAVVARPRHGLIQRRSDVANLVRLH